MSLNPIRMFFTPQTGSCSMEHLLWDPVVVQKAERLKKLHRILRGVARHSFDRPKRYLPGRVYCMSIILPTLNDIPTKFFFSVASKVRITHSCHTCPCRITALAWATARAKHPRVSTTGFAKSRFLWS